MRAQKTRTYDLKVTRSIRIGSDGRTYHGMKNSPEYPVWVSMIQRCTDPNHSAYASLHQQGIRVCLEWLMSFEHFYQDMGPKPHRRARLRRIDANQGFNKENCVWAVPARRKM